MKAVKRRANEESAKAFAAQCVGETEIKGSWFSGNSCKLVKAVFVKKKLTV